MSRPAHLHLVVMGVAGTGKSTVAQAVADELGLVMAEGDDHHPQANIDKMRAGIALADVDRGPWLEALARWTREQHDAGHDTVLTCSALRRRYRDTLRGAVPDPTFFVHLVGSAEVVGRRMATRDHFMPASLLDSQLATLEQLEPDEAGAVVDADRPLAEVVAETLARVRRP